MRILHIAQSAGYGVTIYMESLIQGLKKNGDKQIILGSDYYGNSHFREIADEVITIPMRRNISPKDAATIVKCIGIVKKINPDIVYCHSAKAGIYGRIACIGTKAKVVYNPHGWSFNMKRGKLSTFVYKSIEYVFSWLTDKIVLISQFELDSTPKLFPQSKLERITNGIDIERDLHILQQNALERKNLQIPSDAFVVGIVGRISIQKGQDLFVEVAAKVKERIPSAHFLIVGGKSDDIPLEELISQKGLTDCFTITGEVSDAIRYVPLFDVALFTSRWEGFGLVLPEYMLAKRPVVAFAVDAAKEIIEDHVNGIAVSAGDVDSMAEAVVELSQDKDLYDRLVGNGYKDAISKYDLKRVVEEHRKMFGKLAVGGGKS